MQHNPIAVTGNCLIHFASRKQCEGLRSLFGHATNTGAWRIPIWLARMFNTVIVRY